MALNLGELNAIIDGDDKGFNRTIDRVHRKMDDTAERMDGLTGMLKVLGKATAFSVLATGAAGAASAIGPVLGLVSQLVVAVGGLAAAVPAFAAGAAVAIGTVTLAFTDMGDAIAGDEEALERLSPAAADVVSVLQDQADAWDDVVRSAQEAFWQGLAGDIEKLAATWLPLLEDGLGKVAGGWNDVVSAAAEALGSQRIVETFGTVVDDVAAGLAKFAQGVGPWLEGIAILIGAFSPLLTDAGSAAGQLGFRFAEWIAKAEDAGILADLIQTMKDTLSTIGGIIGNVGSIFSSVFGAANEQSGGLLGTVEKLTGRLADFFNSAEGQTALNTFFDALGRVADAVIPIVLELADVFATQLAPKVATIAEEVGPDLEHVVDRIGEALSRIDVDTVADALGDFLRIASDLLPPLAEIVGLVLDLAPVLIPLASAILIIVGAIKVWRAILIVATIAQWAWNAALFANPITWIILAIVALIAIIILLVMNWDSVTAAIGQAWDWLKEKWASFVEWMQEGISSFIGFFSSKWTEFVGWLQGIWQSIVSYVQDRINEFLDIVGWLQQLPGRVAGWIGDLKDRAVDKFWDLIDWVKGLPDRIMDGLGDLGSLLADAGRDLLQGFLDGIEDMWNSVQDKLSNLTDMLPDWKGPAERDASILRPAGRLVMGGFADGIADGIPAIRRSLEGLTSDIPLMVDAAAAPAASNTMRVDATASLSETDRELLRELAEARTRVDVSLGANLTDATQREYAMGVA
ncbi:phage tail protein [Glycomyces arizonensis]|uniref:phage tail protein n=1 Tax=Glycomyces arizonensis TaxID=256035 RepID=UPI00040DABA4|nr:hypothetical protein [Glycomyces arizonensis]